MVHNRALSAPYQYQYRLRMSVRPVLLVLALFAVVLIVALRPPYELWPKLRVFFVGLALLILAGVGSALARRSPLVSAWLAIGALTSLAYLGGLWLGVPDLPVLLALPAALATTLVGLGAGVATGVALSVLLLVPSPYVASRSVALTGVLAVWGVLGVLYGVHRPVRAAAEWAEDYFERMRGAVEEARDRKADLEHALQDLEHTHVQLTRMNALAQGLRQIAEDARAAKAQFAANVSHELRTPLNMIFGFSQMILEAPHTYGARLPGALLADLEVIHRNAEHLSRLVNDVLELSQLDSDPTALAKEHVRFDELTQLAATAVRPLFESKGLVLTLDVGRELPTVFCDRTRVQEVLMNLLSNAGRVTEQGGVRLCARRDGNQIWVAVADTGPGIAPDDMARLFQPFQQLDGSIRRRHGGTGLGLSISKRFIELHGGRIWAESAPGAGATFTFTLPLTPPAPLGGDFSRWLEPQWEFLARARRSRARTLAPSPRFVVLDPGDTLGRLLERHLDGVEVAAVRDLDQARAELARAPAQALLVNNSSASQALETLTGSTALPDGTPAIICSLLGSATASQELGVADFLVKPVARETLLGALARVCPGGGSVLIVDDEPDALHLFGRMLASAAAVAGGPRYRPLLARDGREALAILDECTPDAIALDLVMPNLDGFQLLELRRQDPRLGAIPVIVVSARDPADQPIVSNALAVTRGGGLSMHQLLSGIRFFSALLSPVGRIGAPAPQADRSG